MVDGSAAIECDGSKPIAYQRDRNREIGDKVGIVAHDRLPLEDDASQPITKSTNLERNFVPETTHGIAIFDEQHLLHTRQCDCRMRHFARKNAIRVAIL